MVRCLITIVQIQARVALSFGIPMVDMTSQRRSMSVAWPRHVAMYLARHLTAQSLPMIGRSFGDRDHSTVMHGINRVTAAVQTDQELQTFLAALTVSLEAPVDVL